MTVPSAASSFARPAVAYDRHIGRYSARLAPELVAFAGVTPGHRALDVGCGPGALTAPLAALLGPAQVCAVDPSPTFAAACAERLPGVRVGIASAEALPFPDATFDHALAQLVVNFLADAPQGVRELRRVTRPGGRVSAAVWDYADGMVLLRTFWEVASALSPAAAGADERQRVRYCSRAELRDLWTAAGLVDVTTGAAVVTAGYDDVDDLWRAVEDGAGPASAFVATLPDERRRELAAALDRALGSPVGPFTLPARAWLVTGTVPTHR